SFSLNSLKGKDWIGTSFGAQSDLIRFWTRNGFVPVAMGPYKNPTTGEYAVVLIKPLSDSAKKSVSKASAQFSLRLLGSLSDVYWDMAPETVLEILESLGPSEKPVLDELEKNRLELYVSGKHVYEFDADIIAKLARWYFGSGLKILSREEKLVLVSKVLQTAVWRVVKEKTKVNEVYETVRTAVEKIVEHL
ncbi:MAG: tRNA(Met) cytidine acetyltransferase, partial [Candidatus Altiarchaeota archaeon]|nr:tRNA(Met) cytidine acetyltransferase [Candidatus Altiarchaeota archaeon]